MQTWYRAVHLASGKTPAQLEREFSSKMFPGRMLPRSCIWEKYRRGEIVPRWRRPDDLVPRVETRYAGTGYWFSTPLWRLADKAPLQMDEVRQIYERMPKMIRAMFIASAREGTGLFWRRPVEAEHACDILRRMANVNAFVATLAMIREAEAMQDQYQHSVGVAAVTRYFELMQTHPVLGHAACRGLADLLLPHWNAAGYFEVLDNDDLTEPSRHDCFEQ